MIQASGAAYQKRAIAVTEWKYGLSRIQRLMMGVAQQSSCDEYVVVHHSQCDAGHIARALTEGQSSVYISK